MKPDFTYLESRALVGEFYDNNPDSEFIFYTKDEVLKKHPDKIIEIIGNDEKFEYYKNGSILVEEGDPCAGGKVAFDTHLPAQIFALEKWWNPEKNKFGYYCFNGGCYDDRRFLTDLIREATEVIFEEGDLQVHVVKYEWDGPDWYQERALPMWEEDLKKERARKFKLPESIGAGFYRGTVNGCPAWIKGDTSKGPGIQIDPADAHLSEAQLIKKYVKNDVDAVTSIELNYLRGVVTNHEPAMRHSNSQAIYPVIIKRHRQKSRKLIIFN